jgi:signal transduction histidine kinase
MAIMGFRLKTTESVNLDVAIEETAHLAEMVGFLLAARGAEERLHVMEEYVREVGHDMASSVQAIVSKLHNVGSGLLQGPLALAKVREAEVEIMSAYRSAETLGITVDPSYSISSGEEFDARSILPSVVMLCRSEANEHHVDLERYAPDDPLPLWGDKRAIETALTQLVMNAIKYARGSSNVKVKVSAVKNDIEFLVADYGKPLDDEEILHMWEFGWRGSKAKELHVNGSGIGLYTVRKIALAHGGTVHAEQNSSHEPAVVRFSFRIPGKAVDTKSALLGFGNRNAART